MAGKKGCNEKDIDLWMLRDSEKSAQNADEHLYKSGTHYRIFSVLFLIPQRNFDIQNFIYFHERIGRTSHNLRGKLAMFYTETWRP